MDHKTTCEKFFKKLLGADFVRMEWDNHADHQLFEGLRFQWINVVTKETTVRVRVPMRVEVESDRDESGRFARRSEPAPVEVAV